MRPTGVRAGLASPALGVLVSLAIGALVSLALGACGGSSTSRSTSTSSATSASSATSTSSATSADGTAAEVSTSTTTGTTNAGGGPTASTTTATSSTATGGNANVRLAATFIIRAGSRLFPPEVAAPKHTTIALTVRAGDSRRHTFEVATPYPYKARVAPGRPGHLTLKGVADGSYALKVDGDERGRLVVGATPGP